MQAIPGRRRTDVIEDILIRQGNASDAAAIAALEEECFSMPHSTDQLIREFNDNLHSAFVAEWHGQIAGFAGITVIADEGYIGNVAVKKEFRRRGIADRLMNALDGLAEKDQLRFISLEVREGNKTALALYEKHGYTLQGCMKNYYTAPAENALIYTKFYPSSLS